ncbi:MAG: hypothetical protein AB1898_27790 [Acidobacteriota bacterium]
MHWERITWQGREAYAVTNDLIRLLLLRGGGHIAEFRFTTQSGMPTVNPLWVPPWKTIEPSRYRQKAHTRMYGPLRDGKLLSGLAGHSLCLDYFGPPSDEEAAAGLSLHGEAPISMWRECGMNPGRVASSLFLGVDLPVAQLRFSRQIQLLPGESVAYITETITNLRKADHFFHWTQHVTLGTPFLSGHQSYTVVSATRGRTDASYDEGKSLLASGRNFRWPLAPAAEGGTVDLSRPLAQRGRGFVVALQLDPRRTIEFVAAVNVRHGLMFGYCFRRDAFPWCAVWDENQAIAAPPWKRKTQAHAFEFGASPFPLPRRDAFALGPLFGTPTLAYIPASGRITVRYLGFLAQLPSAFGKVCDVSLSENHIVICGETARSRLRLLATAHRNLEGGIVSRASCRERTV